MSSLRDARKPKGPDAPPAKDLRGARYWRSLEEWADTPEFRRFVEREFPENASQWADPVGRRRFLKLMGASLAMAGVGACTVQPPERIIPYVKQPEEIVPGKPLYYATAMPQWGIGQGLLVESHMGRPTKIEGNPDHPASLGASNHFSQASILGLYDPDRSDVIRRAGRIDTWDNFLAELASALEVEAGRGGRGLRLLTGTITSPSLAAQIEELLTLYPGSKHHQWEPLNRDNVLEGAKLVFGRPVETRYRFDRAKVIVSLDSDFLAWGPASVRHARDFAGARRSEDGEMSRLYVVEPTPSLTGGVADHRLALESHRVEAVARRLAANLGIEGGAASVESAEQWIAGAVADLQRHRGDSLVVAGDGQPPIVHALAHAINHRLGNVGSTVEYTRPLGARPVNQTESLGSLVDDMRSGGVDLLVILDGNPVYDAPVDFDFAAALQSVKLRIHLSQSEDETSQGCHWHIPGAHFLESWGDVRAFDGTVSIIQPLIRPLYGGRSSHELLGALLGRPGLTAEQAVRDHWAAQMGPDSEKQWRKSVHDGVVAGTAFPPLTPQLDEAALRAEAGSTTSPSGMEVLFRGDPCVADGRYANNGWLQELPKPLTKLTWDNAALISPAMARELSLENGDVVRLSHGERGVEAPIWVLPGQAARSVTVHLGSGHRRAGRVAEGVGFDAYPLRESDKLWNAAGIQIEKTGQRRFLACTQNHHLIETGLASQQAHDRHLVRETEIEEYRSNPEVIHEMGHEFPEEMTLYPPHEYPGHAWGMVIDLGACTGCNACVVACQSENNIPVVGKQMVEMGREMHWIRIDRYFEGDLDDPRYVHQPMICQHCENAPCEVVCPVAATSHSAEGLNEMTYNRCVGTRYCSNNCPYKVRRFNFLLYQDWDTPSLKLMRNPDVTVRSRGVMEKCTFCVQRINAARIVARNEDRKIEDGEIVTACEAACPSQAITFGDINDSASRVARLKADKLNYGILNELNTRPRTTYLARLKNSNPELADG